MTRPVRRGQPAYAFGGLLVAWVLLRAMTWEPLAEPMAPAKAAPMAGRRVVPTSCPPGSPCDTGGSGLVVAPAPPGEGHAPVPAGHRSRFALPTGARALSVQPPAALPGVAVLADARVTAGQGGWGTIAVAAPSPVSPVPPVRAPASRRLSADA